MDKTTLYSMPKDMLVQLISTIQEKSLDLTNVLEYYNTKDNTKERECLKDENRSDMAIRFLAICVEYPELLDRLVKSMSFYAYSHHYRDCEYSPCDDCCSGDTEYEANDNLVTSVKNIIEVYQEEYNNEKDNEEVEDSEEAEESEDTAEITK